MAHNQHNGSLTLEEFLRAPIELVRNVAPTSIILTNGGTRRRAILEGISPASDEYARWTRQMMIRCFELVFRHGVHHIISPLLAESNHDEVTPQYRESLVQWMMWGLAGADALNEYAGHGWQVRLLGTSSWPELQPAADKLIVATAKHNEGPCVWFTVASHAEARWDELFALARTQEVRSRAEAIRALYGQDIPPATLFIGSGKPQVFASIVPPLLVGNLQCYWRQHLGYDLDERTLRTILYDYAYVRPTWQSDKTGRAEQALKYQQAWEDPPVVGLGVRLGPFWYPAPIPPVPAMTPKLEQSEGQ